MKSLFLFSCASLFSIVLQAQLPEGFYLPFGFNYTHETVKDQSLSPVSYSGHLGGLQLGFYYQNSHWLSEFDLAVSGAYQYPDVARDQSRSETISILSRGSYALQYKVWSQNSYHLFVGLISDNLFDYRNHNRYSNSQDNYIGSFSAGPLITLQKSIRLWQQDFVLQSAAGLPVATYYLRPGYIKPYTNYEIGEKSFAGWGDFFLIDLKTQLIWLFENQNQLRISYNWEYAELNKLNKVQLAGHQLALNFVFAF